MDLLISNSYDSVMVVVDHGLMKGVILVPTIKKQTTDATAQILLDNLYKRSSLPDKFISD